MQSKIINKDALKALPELPDESIDLIFADPPYWMRVNGVLERVEGTSYDGCEDSWDNQFSTLEEYESFTRQWLRECKRVLKKDGSIWVIGSMQCIYTIGGIMQQLGYWFINDVIWHKANPTPNFRGTRLNNSHETLIWAAKSDKSRYTFNYKTAKELNFDSVTFEEHKKGVRKQMGTVWKIGICQGKERLKEESGQKLHSTQKPEELLYRIITVSSMPGDVVLDPFGGTMTTAAMAKKSGRRYIMIEKDESYCRYGQERIDNITPHIGEIEKGVFDVPPPKVKFADMIKAGYFHEGETFYLKSNGETAVLKSNGKLLYQGEEIDMHACAARAKNSRAKRLNGFNYWCVKRNGNYVSIDEIRNEYREKECASQKDD